MIETKHSQPIVYRIYDALKAHIGKANAVSGTALSEQFGISQRRLRMYIHEIRYNPELSKVVLTCNKGYYIPLQGESIKDINRLYSQAFSLLRIARASEKKAGLDGQYKLKLGEFYKDYVQAFGE